MNKDHFKSSESVVDTIFSEWEHEVKSQNDSSLITEFQHLQTAFNKFTFELTRKGYVGHFNNENNYNQRLT